jgi:excisionase family DNA binding protein
MDTKIITIENTTVEELSDLVAEKVIKRLNLKKPNEETLLTREETADFLHIDVSTLYHWVKKGKVVCYGIGRRRYFKKQEIIKSLVQLQVYK